MRSTSASTRCLHRGVLGRLQLFVRSITDAEIAYPETNLVLHYSVKDAPGVTLTSSRCQVSWWTQWPPYSNKAA